MGEDTKIIDQTSMLNKGTFVLLGICSLLGWNAVLNSFLFYTVKYNEDESTDNLGEQVSFLFPVPLLFANFFWGPFMPYISTLASPKFRVQWGLITISILLIFLPILAVIANNSVGFGLSMLVTFLIGTANSISQNTLIALATQTGGNLMNLYWISTGISGFCMNFCQFIATLSFGTGGNSLLKGTLFYYGMAIAINIICIFAYFRMIKQPGFEFQELKDKGDQQVLLDPDSNQNTSVASSDGILDDNKSQLQQVIIKIKLGFKTEGYIIPFCIWIIYVQTFMMFPGVTLLKNPFQYSILNDDGWGILLLLTLYNCGDILGKFIGGFKWTINQFLHVITVLARFAFYAIFILIATDKDNSFFQNDWVSFLNILFFATLNGFGTTGFMILGSMKSQKPKELEIIGFINAFMLTFGISCGTFLALPLKNI